MNKKTLKIATLLALGTAIISGTNNFLAKIAVTAVKDPIVFTTLKNGIVALLLIGIVLAFHKRSEIQTLSKKQWGKLIAIGLVGGSIPFALFFTGLTQTTAINAALIHKTLFLWVAIMAVPILKERITFLQGSGIVLLFIANIVLIGGFTGFNFNLGELMILGATLFWAVENIIAKIALKDLSSITVASARMVIGSIVLLLLVFYQGNAYFFTGLTSLQWGWTLLTSVLLLGYVLTWYTALKYAPATYVATLLVPSILVTNILSAIFITHTMTGNDVAAAFLFLVGLLLVLSAAKKTIQTVSEEQKIVAIQK